MIFLSFIYHRMALVRGVVRVCGAMYTIFSLYDRQYWFLIRNTVSRKLEVGRKNTKGRVQNAGRGNGEKDGFIIIKKWEGKKSNTWKGNGKVILEKNGNRL